MRKYIIAAAASLLLLSCNESTDYSVYEGSYKVDNSTVITVNGQTVAIEDYENASITLTLTEGDGCEITLVNFINGQDEVTVPGTVSETGTKTAAGAGFSGQASSEDRTISIEGVTADGTIASITISEEITVEGLAGRWTLSSAELAFYHPDLEVIDLSSIIPGTVIPMETIVMMLNTMVNQAIADDESLSQSYLELTRDGYIQSGDAMGSYDTGHMLAYYAIPGDNIFGIYLRESIAAELLNAIRENPEVMDILDLFGFTSLLENPQSMDIRLSYALTGGNLSLTADQTITEPYLDMLSEPVKIIKSLIADLEDEDVSEFLVMNGLDSIITADNLPAAKDLIISVIDALTDGRAQYSATIGFIPYAG